MRFVVVIFLCLVPVWLGLSMPVSVGAEPDPRAQKIIAAFEKRLPDYEQAATRAEEAIAPLLDSKNENVRAAVDGVRLRIDCIRSIRAIIAKEPNYFIYHLPESSLAKWKEGIEYFLECARSGSDPFRDKLSGVRTVRSPIDGQLLFYVFRLPKDYDARKRYPLEIELHSGAALTWRAAWIDGIPGDKSIASDKVERIWISPCGRGNNSYAGMGEVAVMDAIRDAQRYFAVDTNRVTIGGASMGGTGGFRLSGLHPDVFAAAHSLTGGADYAVPVGDGRFDGYLLADNYCNTGMCIWDATKEGHFTKNRAFADQLRKRAAQFAGYYPNLELTDENGGHGIIDKKLRDEGWLWIRKQARSPLPRRVIYKTYNLRYDGAYWARIDTIQNPAAPARIEAEVREDRSVTVSTENVDRFHLELVKELVGEAGKVNVIIDSSSVVKAPTGPRVFFARIDGKWSVHESRYPKGLVKKHSLSGPIQDVFMENPVLMVRGTGSGQDAAYGQRMIDDAVRRLFGAGDGGRTLHTPFERKADGEVTAQDISAKNLVLFGGLQQNLLVRKIAAQLPVKFLDSGIELGGKTFQGKGVGLVMVYPNPLNPDRYVLLLPENYAGGEPLQYPDYMVVRPVDNGKTVQQQILTQGSFDTSWNVISK